MDTQTFKSIGNSRKYNLLLQKVRVFFMTERVMTEIVCSDCGKTATVPFKPTAGKPVYCKECLTKHRTNTRQTKSKNQDKANPKQAWSRRRDNWKGQTEKPVTA
jgi:CxxC-x17-CxxC domain-containing protein